MWSLSIFFFFLLSWQSCWARQKGRSKRNSKRFFLFFNPPTNLLWKSQLSSHHHSCHSSTRTRKATRWRRELAHCPPPAVGAFRPARADRWCWKYRLPRREQRPSRSTTDDSARRRSPRNSQIKTPFLTMITILARRLCRLEQIGKNSISNFARLYETLLLISQWDLLMIAIKLPSTATATFSLGNRPHHFPKTNQKAITASDELRRTQWSKEKRSFWERPFPVRCMEQVIEVYIEQRAKRNSFQIWGEGVGGGGGEGAGSPHNRQYFYAKGKEKRTKRRAVATVDFVIEVKPSGNFQFCPFLP